MILHVGMMLRGMGFDNTASIYISEKYMALLRQLFPLLETKDTLASSEEQTILCRSKSCQLGYSSRLAALDYTVCAQSVVFVILKEATFPISCFATDGFFMEGIPRTSNLIKGASFFFLFVLVKFELLEKQK